MKSILDGEKLIVMDVPSEESTSPGHVGEEFASRAMTINEAKMVADAGVKTVTYFAQWHRMEKVPGQMDWSITDQILYRNRQAGLKTLFLVYSSAAEYFPPDYYQQAEDGKGGVWVANNVKATAWSMLSPWNKDAQYESKKFITNFIKHYTAPDVEFGWTLCKEGETVIMPECSAWQDPHAIASRNNQELLPWLKETLVDYWKTNQDLFPVKWMFLHRAFTWKACNFIDEMAASLAGHDIYNLQWTYWPHRMLIDTVDADTRKYGFHSYAGAEWCEGLATNGPKVKQHPLDGLIVGPIHPVSGRKGIEPWMLENMKIYLRQFNS